ncbi:MAG: SDR family oxidoreductase [Anaerolineae bacterium]|nr:SDR family oxidoreductase [Anaerolineae bacterium]
MFTLTDQVVVVTGATGNLGSATVRALQQAGARLALVDRSIDASFDQHFPALAGMPERYLPLKADLTDEAEVEAMVERTLAHFGVIDGLVNIAGGYRGGTPVHETDPATLQFLFDLNVRTMFLASRAVLPHMIARRKGRIVSVSARAALQGSRNMAAYSLAKAAVVRLTESMAAEVRQYGVNVNAVLPGTIDTPQNRADMPQADFSRWVAPEALADVILFLLSEAARAIHGAAIPVYGLS